jgi:polyhydroxyalkanoate synthase
MAEAVEADAKTRTRVRFAVEQWIGASAPSNFFAFNAEAQKKALETQGESIARGIAEPAARRAAGPCVHDGRKRLRGRPQRGHHRRRRGVRERAVPADRIQAAHRPRSTSGRYLLVPPCINKFYILDLQPENSLIRYCVEQGHRTFVVSWRNPDASMAHKTWDEYIEDAAIKAIGSRRTSRVPTRRAGRSTRSASASAAPFWAPHWPCWPRAARAGELRHLLTTLLDFTDTGVLDMFIDEAFVKFREMQMGHGGLLAGGDLAIHLQLPAAQRPGVELRGGQLPQGRDAAALRPAVLEQRRHQPAGTDVRAGTCATPTWRTTWSSPAS